MFYYIVFSPHYKLKKLRKLLPILRNSLFTNEVTTILEIAIFKKDPFGGLAVNRTGRHQNILFLQNVLNQFECCATSIMTVTCT